MNAQWLNKENLDYIKPVFTIWRVSNILGGICYLRGKPGFIELPVECLPEGIAVDKYFSLKAFVPVNEPIEDVQG